MSEGKLKAGQFIDQIPGQRPFNIAQIELRLQQLVFKDLDERAFEVWVTKQIKVLLLVWRLGGLEVIVHPTPIHFG